jgi:short-subunit dehydrogenase
MTMNQKKNNGNKTIVEKPNAMSIFRQKYGPWALITGASSGMGAEFARQLAEKDLNLILVARRKEKLEELANELKTQNNIQAKIIPLDLSRSDFMTSLRPVTDSLEIGLLINNAGVAVNGEFLENNLEDELRILDINCRTPLILAHEFGRKMTERKKGGIIFLSSMVAYQGTPFTTTYAGTKAFNLSLAEGLSYELKGQGVDVLALSPGFTNTEMLEGMDFSHMPIKPMPVKPVVASALKALGHESSVVPGGMNQVINFLGKYLFTRSVNTTIFGKIMGKLKETKGLQVQARIASPRP